MGSFLGNLIADAVLAAIRHLLAGVGVWLVAQHYASQADETKWLGALMTAIGLSWSFYDKYAKAQRLKEAKALVVGGA
jgi:hypothetical protein